MRLDENSVPRTIEEAVQKIVAGLSKEDVEAIRTKDTAGCHFGAGMAIRNCWSIWAPNSPLKRDAAEKYQIAHADDISGLIFDWAFASVRGEDFDPVARCEVYHKHWKRYNNMTSLEAGGWPPTQEDIENWDKMVKDKGT